MNFPNLKYIPFYVGKGVGDRYMDLNRNDSHRKIRTNLKEKQLDIVPFLAQENLSEKEALMKESILIDLLGLKCFSKHGMLVNLDEGYNNDIRRYNLSKDNEMYKKIIHRNGFNIEK